MMTWLQKNNLIFHQTPLKVEYIHMLLIHIPHTKGPIALEKDQYACQCDSP